MRKRRMSPSIDTGTFADVSFLLMIFFMVVTTFNKNYSFEMNLPPIQENVEEKGVNPNRVLEIHINSENEYLIDNTTFGDISGILVAEKVIDIGSHPLPGIIRLEMSPLASYQSYLEVLSLIKRSKRKAKNIMAINSFGHDYHLLSQDQKNSIDEQVLFKLSELETDEI